MILSCTMITATVITNTTRLTPTVTVKLDHFMVITLPDTHHLYMTVNLNITFDSLISVLVFALGLDISSLLFVFEF